MEITTQQSPSEVLERFERFAVEGWDLGRGLSSPTPSTRKISALQRSLFDTGGGILALLVLSVLTGGLFFVAYLVYFLVFRDKSMYAQVTATRGSTGTHVQLIANRPDWEKRLTEWAEQDIETTEA